LRPSPSLQPACYIHACRRPAAFAGRPAGARGAQGRRCGVALAAGGATRTLAAAAPDKPLMPRSASVRASCATPRASLATSCINQCDAMCVATMPRSLAVVAGWNQAGDSTHIGRAAGWCRAWRMVQLCRSPAATNHAPVLLTWPRARTLLPSDWLPVPVDELFRRYRCWPRCWPLAAQPAGCWRASSCLIPDPVRVRARASHDLQSRCGVQSNKSTQQCTGYTYQITALYPIHYNGTRALRGRAASSGCHRRRLSGLGPGVPCESAT
jgi:hypothetical protein